MEKYREFYDFLIESRQQFFIEVEAKQDDMERFIENYNQKYARNVNRDADGVCVLGDVDKWGKQLRVYFNDKTNIPNGLHVQNNNRFRNVNYPYRLDDNSLIEFLFAQGCVLGIN